jgi:hypothetical protein
VFAPHAAEQAELRHPTTAAAAATGASAADDEKHRKQIRQDDQGQQELGDKPHQPLDRLRLHTDLRLTLSEAV